MQAAARPWQGRGSRGGDVVEKGGLRALVCGTMQLDDVAGARAVVQPVHVLRQQRSQPAARLQPGQRLVRRVRLHLQTGVRGCRVQGLRVEGFRVESLEACNCLCTS